MVYSPAPLIADNAKPPQWNAEASLSDRRDWWYGLVAGVVWPFSGGGYEIVRRKPFVIAGGNPDTQVTRDGVALRSDSVDEALTLPGGPYRVFKGDHGCTIMMGVQILGTPTGNSAFFGMKHNSTNSSPFWGFGLAVNTGPNWVLNYNDGGSFEQFLFSPVVGPAAGQFVWLAASAAPNGTLRMELSSGQTRTFAGLLSGEIQYGSTTQLTISETGLSRNSNFLLRYGYLWNRYIPMSVIRQIGADPYGLVRPNWDFLAGGAVFPSAPTNLTATAVSTSQINLSWDAVSGAGGYDIERDGSVIVSDQAGTTFNDTGLNVGQSYDYRVRAVS